MRKKIKCYKSVIMNTPGKEEAFTAGQVYEMYEDGSGWFATNNDNHEHQIAQGWDDTEWFHKHFVAENYHDDAWDRAMKGV